MRINTALRARRAESKRRPARRLLLEWLEDRLVPSIPDGTIIVTTSPSPYSPTGDLGYPTGLYGVNPNGGAQFPISVDNPNDTTGHFNLFSLPTYVCEGPDGQLYATDYTARTTGAIIKVDQNTGQQTLLATGAFINGPNAIAFVNGFLYVANASTGPGDLVRLDSNTGAQTLISKGDNGTSTGGNTSTTLNDTTKNWTPDQWVGWTVVITGGTGVGQNATISSNTATQLTIAGSWSTLPDNSSTYEVGFSDPTGMAPGPDKNIYVADGSGVIYSIDIASGRQTEITQGNLITHPVDVALEASGNLIVLSSQTSAANPYGSLIRVVPSTGAQSLVFTESYPYTDNSIAVGQNSGIIFIGADSSGNNPGEIFAFDPATGIKTTVAANTTTLSLVEGIAVYQVPAPTLDPLPDRTVPASQTVITVMLSGHDSDGLTSRQATPSTITTTARARSGCWSLTIPPGTSSCPTGS